VNKDYKLWIRKLSPNNFSIENTLGFYDFSNYRASFIEGLEDIL